MSKHYAAMFRKPAFGEVLDKLRCKAMFKIKSTGSHPYKKLASNLFYHKKLVKFNAAEYATREDHYERRDMLAPVIKEALGLQDDAPPPPGLVIPVSQPPPDLAVPDPAD